MKVTDGLCYCGCGRETRVSPRTVRRYGYVTGQHRRYVRGHHPDQSKTVEESFWPRVDKTSSESGCWLWTGAASAEGYGHFKLHGRNAGSHRVAYELIVGPIPDGLHLDHLCRVHNCVNPQHLEPVTPAENVRRSDGITARNSRKTACIQGHEFTPENTYVHPVDKTRACRTCKRAASTRYNHKRRNR